MDNELDNELDDDGTTGGQRRVNNKNGENGENFVVKENDYSIYGKATLLSCLNRREKEMMVATGMVKKGEMTPGAFEAKFDRPPDWVEEELLQTVYKRTGIFCSNDVSEQAILDQKTPEELWAIHEVKEVFPGSRVIK